MATIRTAGAGSITNIFGAIGTTASALTSAAAMADDYISGAASNARVYRARAEADADAKIIVATANAEDKAVAWLVQQEVEIASQLDTKEKADRFKELKALHFTK